MLGGGDYSDYVLPVVLHPTVGGLEGWSAKLKEFRLDKVTVKELNLSYDVWETIIITIHTPLMEAGGQDWTTGKLAEKKQKSCASTTTCIT